MSERNPNILDVVQAVLLDGLDRVHTSLVASVVSYDAARQTVVAQPLVERSYTDAEGARRTEALPAATDVPVVFPGAGGYSITWPIAAGDQVLLIVSEQCLDRWKRRGTSIGDPLDDRRFNLADAIAIPGIRAPGAKGGAGPGGAGPIDSPPTSAMVLTAGDLRLGDKTASGAGDRVVVQDALDDFLSALSTAAGLDTSGALTLLQAKLALLNTGTGWKARTSKTYAT